MDLREEIRKEIKAILREVKSFKIDIMIAKHHNKLAIKVHDPVFEQCIDIMKWEETERFRNEQLLKKEKLWSRMNRQPLYYRDGPKQVWLKGPGHKGLCKIEKLRKRKLEDE